MNFQATAGTKKLHELNALVNYYHAKGIPFTEAIDKARAVHG